MNSPNLVRWRLTWMRIIEVCQKNDPKLFASLMSYPNDMPDLSVLKLCRAPAPDSTDQGSESACHVQELFFLCRSQNRLKKDEAIISRSEEKIHQWLQSMSERCETQNRDVQKVEREVGRLLGQNTRAARLFEATESGSARLTFRKNKRNDDWATLSAGCYLLRTNVLD